MTNIVDFDTNNKTLTDWVKDFRLKKIQMKRKLRQNGGQLRVCAILSTALKSAEKELRQKQQERFNRWSELQMQLIQNKNEIYWSRCANEVSQERASKMKAEEKRQQEISELWKHEISSLDEFMRNMSSQRCPVGAS